MSDKEPVTVSQIHLALTSLVNQYEKRMDALIAENHTLRADRAEEAAEFNAGYDAHKQGKSMGDEPSGLKYDMWRVGFAWAAYDGLCAENARLLALKKEHDAMLDAKPSTFDGKIYVDPFGAIKIVVGESADQATIYGREATRTDMVNYIMRLHNENTRLRIKWEAIPLQALIGVLVGGSNITMTITDRGRQMWEEARDWINEVEKERYDTPNKQEALDSAIESYRKHFGGDA